MQPGTVSRTYMRGMRALRAHVKTDSSMLAFDALVVAGSYVGVLILRFDGHVPGQWRANFIWFLVAAVVLHLAGNLWAGLYRQMWAHASVFEARRVLRAGGAAAVLLMCTYVAIGHPVPLSVAVLGPFVATMLMGGLRFQSRMFTGARRRDTNVGGGLRVVVVGAGEAGASIAREMQRSPSAGLVPVAFVDDDPRKIGLALLGVPVVDSIDRLKDVVEQLGAHRVVLAITGAHQRLVRRVAAAAEAAEVPLQVLPGFGELMRDNVSLRDVRDLQIEDLIGREQVKIDLDAVKSLISGKRVLITGGGGSIGSEIARQVARCEPAKLVLVDHDETHLHDVAATVSEPVACVLADIRDTTRVRQVFERHRPQLVFHAAAHKHVPILEEQACEAVATNVLGTQNVVESAESVGAERVVFISTDKAVNPANVMGATKWLGEQIVLSRASGPTRFSAVRFGNVLGSRGSVIPTFARQIQTGGPVTVTDPRMTRFFMTIEEAVKLVLQAAVFSNGGDVFMLEMGNAVNILELAKRMIRLSGHQVGTEIEIEITGPRGGEKLAEELSASDERPSLTDHEAVVRLDVARVAADTLCESLAYFELVAQQKDDDAAVRALFELAGRERFPLAVPTSTPPY
jgi:FlaA1/EpsC-like NDP-sugar epimerase